MTETPPPAESKVSTSKIRTLEILWSFFVAVVGAVAAQFAWEMHLAKDGGLRSSPSENGPFHTVTITEQWNTEVSRLPFTIVIFSVFSLVLVLLALGFRKVTLKSVEAGGRVYFAVFVGFALSWIATFLTMGGLYQLTVAAPLAFASIAATDLLAWRRWRWAELLLAIGLGSLYWWT